MRVLVLFLFFTNLFTCLKEKITEMFDSGVGNLHAEVLLEVVRRLHDAPVPLHAHHDREGELEQLTWDVSDFSIQLCWSAARRGVRPV